MRSGFKPLRSVELAAFCIKIDCLRELRQSCSLTPNTEISRTISRRDTHVVFGKKNYMALHLDDIMGSVGYYHTIIGIFQFQPYIFLTFQLGMCCALHIAAGSVYFLHSEQIYRQYLAGYSQVSVNDFLTDVFNLSNLFYIMYLFINIHCVQFPVSSLCFIA